jgi:hypothetical protein
LPDIQQSWSASALVLRARLAELSEPANANEIRQTLQAALRLDPRNNVARNLLEKYLDAPRAVTK